MELFNNKPEPQKKKTGGILGQFSVDVIKYEPEKDQEASFIAHKFETEDFPSGSQLIVGPSQIAVFINNIGSGNSLKEGGTTSQVAVFIGPCKVKLETGDSRFAPFRNLAHALTNGDSAYHSSVYFINTTYMNELDWGTQASILVVDPVEEVNVHVRAYGKYGVHIEQVDTGRAAVQASKFLRKVVGTRADYTRDELTNFMRAKILEFVPDMIAKGIVDRHVSVLNVSALLSEFSEQMRSKLIPHFDDFGLTLDNFSFHSINVPEDDLAAINETKIKRRQDRLEAEGTAAKMDIESEARARMRQREGYTYQQEQAYGVMQSAAQNEGTPSAFMGAGMGLGMGVGMGGAFGVGMTKVADEALNPPKPGETICPDCGSTVPSGARFCHSCGKKILEEIICPDCGAKLPANAKFCLNCGKKLTAAPTVCPKCGAALTPGSKFCMSCGEKI